MFISIDELFVYINTLTEHGSPVVSTLASYSGN